jgi:hypothetical protein
MWFPSSSLVQHFNCANILTNYSTPLQCLLLGLERLAEGWNFNALGCEAVSQKQTRWSRLKTKVYIKTLGS